ncbi:hypothetical protein R6Q59_029235 [Mikania micrantha]
MSGYQHVIVFILEEVSDLMLFSSSSVQSTCSSDRSVDDIRSDAVALYLHGSRDDCRVKLKAVKMRYLSPDWFTKDQKFNSYDNLELDDAVVKALSWFELVVSCLSTFCPGRIVIALDLVCVCVLVQAIEYQFDNLLIGLTLGNTDA